MGLIQKFKSRTNLRNLGLLRRSRKQAAGREACLLAAAQSDTRDENWNVDVVHVVHVASHRRECPPTDSRQTFNNWLTNKMDDLLSTISAYTGGEESNNNDAPAIPTSNDKGEETAWMLIGNCWGSASKTDDVTYGSSHDDWTGESSQVSVSRVDQVLELSSPASGVSGITASHSIDDNSDLENEHLSESEDEDVGRN
mmetsp:Transcript_19442/g.41571  ORF Transcript_19442/g.41571 Transcript_19442/m.41571 type:complete len:198 (+) Transcript_19442:165-758(+)|eukprot:CAMPEP_0172542962 /NCGR_PEP_ID=MMETSP1067-20121228/13460_1 /TAXON_ID=265564 ORGANISM="Thalassiosira punctigera, Strain Tpunct2005C2" /NCGR_SAMPLE_ID=MMETSP1067 /ASSEMBLY_ACC=CAM_ASM_000444 /LENGTH=197 /DNA_ID=CAMNT_0013329271 /DNA_START=100 /DNA_END=693 /DNA_ORIENTATION=-